VISHSTACDAGILAESIEHRLCYARWLCRKLRQYLKAQLRHPGDAYRDRHAFAEVDEPGLIR